MLYSTWYHCICDCKMNKSIKTLKFPLLIALSWYFFPALKIGVQLYINGALFFSSEKKYFLFTSWEWKVPCWYFQKLYTLGSNHISHQQIMTPPSTNWERAYFQRIVLTFKVRDTPYVIVEVLKNQHIIIQMCRFNEYWQALCQWTISQTRVAPIISMLCFGVFFFVVVVMLLPFANPFATELSRILVPHDQLLSV